MFNGYLFGSSQKKSMTAMVNRQQKNLHMRMRWQFLEKLEKRIIFLFKTNLRLRHFNCEIRFYQYSTFGIGGFQMGSGLNYCIFDLETKRFFDKNAIKQA
jgi:hypothetical protein